MTMEMWVASGNLNFLCLGSMSLLFWVKICCRVRRVTVCRRLRVISSLLVQLLSCLSSGSWRDRSAHIRFSWSLLNPLGRVHRGTIRGNWIIYQCSFWRHWWSFSRLANSGLGGDRRLRSLIRSSWSYWGHLYSDPLPWTCCSWCHWCSSFLLINGGSLRWWHGPSDFLGWWCSKRGHLLLFDSVCLRLVMKWSILSSVRNNRILGLKAEGLDILYLSWGRCFG